MLQTAWLVGFFSSIAYHPLQQGLKETLSSAFQCTKNQNEWGKRFMNKAEFIDAVASKGDMSKADATSAVDAVLDSVTAALKDGEQITLVGFGTFLVRKREARTGRNPRTGEPLQIKASNVPSFKAGKALKDAVN